MPFRLLSFLGAFLLFALEPMIGKAALPAFGGGAGVWLACLLFFQVVVVAGYAYSHLALKLTGARLLRMHGGLICLTILLLGFAWFKGGSPFLPAWDGSNRLSTSVPLALLGRMTLSAGLGLLTLSTTSPLVQAWYFRAHDGQEPYHLYAISNWGSFAGLLAYPLVLEPLVGLRTQARLACLGFLVYGVLVLVLLRQASWKGPQPLLSEVPSSPAHGVAAWRPHVVWVGLSALGTLWLLCISGSLSTDIAAIPLMWILPLGAYLLTFVLAFRPRARPFGRTPILASVAVLSLFAVQLALPNLLEAFFPGLGSKDPGLPASTLRLLQWVQARPLLTVLFSLAALVSACFLAHTRLAALRPHGSRLTGYYLSMAIGGALGGLFVSLGAPLLFSQNFELPLALLAALWVGLLDFRQGAPHPTHHGLALATIGCAAGLLALLGGWSESSQLYFRDFFGTIRVYRPHPGLIQMAQGRTVHGIQFAKEPLRPAAYYGLESGIGLAMRTLQAERPALAVGVIGLGVGNVLGYGRQADCFTVYEISPKIIQISGMQGSQFKVASSTPARVDIQEGDGRILLARDVKLGRKFDLLLVDAFAGGSIPMHLLTTEALQLYLSSLKPGGILALHVTHRLPLERQVGAGLSALRVPAVQVRCGATYGRDKVGRTFLVEMPSIYWLASNSPDLILRPEILQKSVARLDPREALHGADLTAFGLQVPNIYQRPGRPWTDDKSSLVPLFF